MPSSAVDKLDAKSNDAEKRGLSEIGKKSIAKALYDLKGRCESSFRHGQCGAYL